MSPNPLLIKVKGRDGETHLDSSREMIGIRVGMFQSRMSEFGVSMITVQLRTIKFIKEYELYSEDYK